MHKLSAVIIGGSHAAAQLSVSLRQEGWSGDILIISDEHYLPYHRPPLSKTFLSGDKSIDDLLIRPAAFYEKNNIQFLNGHVIKIDRQRQRLSLADGTQVNYDKLALCTGARVRKLAIEGADLNGVHYVRNATDIEAIQLKIKNVKHAVIMGGGYIGLETAASLRKQGIQVSLIEASQRILQRVTTPELSAFYSRIHTEEGVSIYTDLSVERILGTTDVQGILCANGMTLETDLIIVGIGVQPNVELALEAGLHVENGVVVDQYCQTNDSHIVAAGDCTAYFNQRYQRQIRLESVPNANEQAKIAAATLCGVSKVHNSLPWFWSDQYDLKLQIAGLNQGYDQQIIRGNMHNERQFSVFYLKAGELIAADCINRPLDFMVSKKIIHEQLKIDVAQLADETFDLRELLK